MKKAIRIALAFLCVALAFGLMGCDSTLHEHTWTLVVDNEPNYFAKGIKVYRCECGEIKTEEYGTIKTYSSGSTSLQLLPAGTDGTAGTGAQYVTFGEFPQTKAEEGITFSSEPQSNGYYLGSDGCDYERYYGYYYKVEPIKWRVLEVASGKKNGKETTRYFLLAENILTYNLFYEAGTSSGEHPNGSLKNNYKDSRIRAYLNGISYDAVNESVKDKYLNKGFLQTAFSDADQAIIMTTEVDNSAASTLQSNNSCVCENTYDKIFLLSRSEHDKLLTTTESRRRVSQKGSGIVWWLRSPADYSEYNYYFAHCSDGNGYSFNLYGVNGDYGVVPALWVEF